VCESMQCMKAISPQMVYDMIKAEFIAGTKRGRR
jgi:hypothetical protein